MKRSTKERLLGLLIIIPVLIMVLTMCSNCIGKTEAQKEMETASKVYKTTEEAASITIDHCISYVQTIIIDNCEYVVIQASGYGSISITHKGNCYNSIHYDLPVIKQGP